MVVMQQQPQQETAGATIPGSEGGIGAAVAGSTNWQQQKQATDCETLPPSSDCELLESIDLEATPRELSSILLKMEELNKLNEADARSVTSKISASSSSSNTGGSGSPSRTVGRTESCHNFMDQPESVGGNMVVGDTTQRVGDSGVGDVASSGRPDDCQPEDEDDNEVDLWTVWGNLIKSWESEMKRRPNCVKELVRRGVPQHFRTIAWQLLSNAKSQQIHDLYTEYLRQSSPYEKVILRDIPRTYPELEFFKDGGRGQQSLFNVIKCYSIHDREVGYCQGSAFIVGQLLLQMPEEEAFSVFVRLMEHYRLRELYKPTMTQLGLCMFQLEVIVQEQMPDLYMHFNNMGFDTSMYASSWFLTLFTTTLSLDLANRIMDLFLVDGMDAIFRLALAILQQSRIELLKLDMEGMLKYFQRDIKELYENDHDLLFAVAARVILNAKRMKRLEKDYLAKRSKEQEEAIELRRLRTENRLLRQRIEYLEQESSALADRLIRGQVDLAQQADNCLSVSHELNVLRDINSEAHRRLEDAYETIRELSGGGPGEKHLVESGAQVDDTSMIEHIHSLQQELIETHSKKSDLENNVREMKLRIYELESTNKRLKESSPDGGIAAIQEELIRVKMREAEASLSLKEMRQRLSEMEQQWTKYMECRAQAVLQSQSMQKLSSTESTGSLSGSPSVLSSTLTINEQGEEQCCSASQASPSSSSSAPSPTANNGCPSTAPQRARDRIAKFTASLMGAAGSMTTAANGVAEETGEGGWMTTRDLEDQFMGLKIREADTLAELKEMRQKVMELETQNHVCTNQLRRQDEELKRIKEEKEAIQQAEREASKMLKDEQRKLMEAQSEMKEKNVMQRLKYTEALQNIADLKQHIAHYESRNAEKLAQAQLRGSSICDIDDDSVASNRSAGSFADSNSLASEEMTAFLAEVSVTGKTQPLYAQDEDSDQDVAHSATDDITDDEEELLNKKSKNTLKSSLAPTAANAGKLTSKTKQGSPAKEVENL